MPPELRQTQLGGFVHYPIWGESGRAKHPPENVTMVTCHRHECGNGWRPCGDRVLAVTHAGRLAVVELKAEEGIHLPLQELDYWSRVEWHHARGEFPRFGYFEGRELSADKPLLISGSSGVTRASSWGLTSAGART